VAYMGGVKCGDMDDGMHLAQICANRLNVFDRSDMVRC
jgi:hypothetical protein